MTTETVSPPTSAARADNSSSVSTRARMRLPSLHNNPWIGNLAYGSVLIVAAIGSGTAAVQWLGWPLFFAIPAVLLGELFGVYLMQIADQRRRLGEQAYAARVLSAAVALGMVALNWFGHADEPMQAGFFAGASALGYCTWLIQSGARRRDQLRADGRLPEAPPVFGLARWLRHPFATAEARQIAQQFPDLGLYGSLEVVRLRPVIKPWLRKILTQVHGKESAAFMIAIMDAKGMADMVRDLIRFDVIAVALAHTINAPYLTEGTQEARPAPAGAVKNAVPVDALEHGDSQATSNGHRASPASDGQAGRGEVTERVPSTAAPARERTSAPKPRAARKPAPERYSKSTDEQRIERLRELARESLDGKVGVREAARELRSGPDTARRLLQLAGLYRDSDTSQ